jgi:hypothetical protein
LRLRRVGLVADLLAADLAGYLKSEVCKLEELQITSSGLTASGSSRLFPGLSANKSLAIVRFDYNPLGSEGLGHLCDGLSTSASLRSFSAQFCEVEGQAGAIALRPLLMFVRSNMAELNLQGNQLGFLGFMELITCGFLRAKNLRRVNLAGNSIVDNKWIDTSGQGIYIQPQNEKEDEADIEVNEATPPNPAAIVPSSLRESSDVTSFDSSDLSESLQHLILSNRNIEYLLLHGNQISETTAKMILQLLATAKHVRKLTLQHNLPGPLIADIAKLLISNSKKLKGKKGGTKKK